MKRILTILFLVLSLSGFSQNFFGSHTAEKICFGYLYNEYAVADSRGITSSSEWALPNDAQFQSLKSYVTGSSANLKRTGFLFWNAPNTGALDSLGFHGIGGGRRDNSGAFGEIKTSGNWRYKRSSTIYGMFSMSSTTSLIGFIESIGNPYGTSIRLVKDATGLADGVTTTYTGNDGKTYNGIVINELYWTTENLEEILFRNGDTIPNVIDNTDWSNLTTGARCTYNNNELYKCK